MNRLQFFLHAKTQYNLHSPFVFDFYRQVLFAPLSRPECKRLGLSCHDHYHTLTYKLVNYLRPERLYIPYDDATTRRCANKAHAETCVEVLSPTLDPQAFETFSPNDIILFPSPHDTQSQEMLWESLYHHPAATATIDLYYAGIIFFRHTLSRQHFLLR